MKTLLVDAFDSFVFIIDQYLLGLNAGPTVVRSKADNAALIRETAPDLLVLGPGPGHPVDSGHVELVHEFAGAIPILGVCLGHQAIASAFGAHVLPAQNLMHGKTSEIDHDGRGLFAGAADHQIVTRYHSLIVDELTVPAELEISARSRDDGYVMGLRHRSLPIESVQFHPESITTEGGLGLVEAYLRAHVPAWGEASRSPTMPITAPVGRRTRRTSTPTSRGRNHATGWSDGAC
jgi:anthranilate synthase component 2